MEALVLIILCVYVALKVIFVETKHDYYVILSEAPEKLYEEKWKQMGLVSSGTEIVALSACGGFIIGFLAILLVPIACIVWSIFHDCGMGYRLKKDVFYLGSRGYDAWISQVFQGSGFLFFVFKVVWLVIFIGTYLGI